MYTKTHALFFSFPDIDRCQVNFEPIGCYKAVSQPLDDYILTERNRSKSFCSGIPIDWHHFGAYIRDFACPCGKKL